MRPVFLATFLTALLTASTVNAADATVASAVTTAVAVAENIAADTLATNQATTPTTQPTPTAPTLIIHGRAGADLARIEPSAAAAVLPQASLDKPAATLGEALKQTPGVRATSDGSLGGRSSASIRGSNGQHTQVYLDGVLLNSGFLGLANLATIPLGSIDRVEVYRSATPFGFGAPAIGGAINVVSKKPQQSQAGATLGAGSFGSYDGGAHFSLPISQAAAVLGSVNYQRSRGNFTFLNDKGTAFDTRDDEVVKRGNNQGEQIDGLFKASYWLAGGASLTLLQSLYGFRGGLPGNGLRQPTVAERDDIRSLTQLGFAELALGKSAWDMAGGAHYTFTRQRQRDPLDEFGLTANDSDNRSNMQGLRLQAAGPIKGGFSLAQGLNVDYESYKPFDALYAGPQVPRSSRTTSVLSLEPRLSLLDGDLMLLALGSYVYVKSDVRRTIGLGGTLVEAPPTGRHRADYRLGLRYAATNWLELKSNFNDAHREPAFFELFGDAGFIQPSPLLKPEHGRTVDAGASACFEFREKRDNISLEIFGFRSHIQDLIQFVRATSDTFVAQNFDAANFWGIESQASWDGFEVFALTAVYDWLWSKATSESPARDGKDLPLRPRHRSSLRGELYRAHLNIFDRLAVYAEYNVESANYLDASNVVRVPSRSVVDLGLAAKFLDGDLSADFVVRNVNNNRITDLINYPLPGRNYYGSVHYQFM